jgi:hypothetical protein
MVGAATGTTVNGGLAPLTGDIGEGIVKDYDPIVAAQRLAAVVAHRVNPAVPRVALCAFPCHSRSGH